MLVFDKKGRLLLAEREGRPGHWQFPQGGAESDRSLEENVIKELKEELGLKRRHLGKITQLEATHEYDWENPPSYAKGKWRGQAQTFWAVEFLGDDNDIRLDADEEQELSDWCWCSIEEVEKRADPKRLEGYTKALQSYRKVAPWKMSPAS
jgi:putative (di)nucleoside polyphosphate hydrolase